MDLGISGSSRRPAGSNRRANLDLQDADSLALPSITMLRDAAPEEIQTQLHQTQVGVR
jgi:hypothetical protein